MTALPDTVLIEVTQDDIDTGRPGNPFCCAVARAASRALGLPVGATGYDMYVYESVPASPTVFTRGNRIGIYEFPEEVQDFVDRFDEDRKDRTSVEPMSFTAVRTP